MAEHVPPTEKELTAWFWKPGLEYPEAARLIREVRRLREECLRVASLLGHVDVSKLSKQHERAVLVAENSLRAAAEAKV